MAIRSSASQEVRRLVADLTAVGPDQPTRRESATARLAIIGTRSVRQLLEALAAATAPSERVAILVALEAIPDPRLSEPVVTLLGPGDEEVRLAAARTARGLLSLRGAGPVLDRLTALALDVTDVETVRAAAFEALTALPPRTLKPVVEQLKDDPSPAVRTVLRRAGAVADDPVGELEESSDGWLPRDPHVLGQLVARAGADAPLSTLHRLIERVRSKETEGRKKNQAEWLRVRGALHLALARRGSNVAVYDLREAVERATEPLPGEFLEALALVGDATTLEPIVGAYAHSEAVDDGEQWRRGLADAFRAIVAREKITGRHAAMKRLRSRFRDHVAILTGDGRR